MGFPFVRDFPPRWRLRVPRLRAAGGPSPVASPPDGSAPGLGSGPTPGRDRPAAHLRARASRSKIHLGAFLFCLSLPHLLRIRFGLDPKPNNPGASRGKRLEADGMLLASVYICGTVRRILWMGEPQRADGWERGNGSSRDSEAPFNPHLLRVLDVPRDDHPGQPSMLPAFVHPLLLTSR